VQIKQMPWIASSCVDCQEQAGANK